MGVGEGLMETSASMGVSVWRAHNGRDRTLLTLGAILCYLLFAWLATMFHIPRYRGFADSLLQQPAPWMTILVVTVGTFACAMIASAIAGVVHFDAGLF